MLIGSPAVKSLKFKWFWRSQQPSASVSCADVECVMLST